LKKLLMFVLVLLLAACNGGGEPAGSPEQLHEIELPEFTPGLILPPPEYPIIDGSSSTVMMHAAIRAFLTDEHFVDYHSRTYEAFERLIPGSNNPADVILAVKYYDETLHDARERGADLVVTPVAKEGFVFILHEDNPVDSLTQQQLRDIYAGRITNWKEVGGKDERIIAYVRNWDSGSQTAMESFMGGEEIFGWEDSIISGMSFLLTQVETTGSAAIGFNIFSWSMEQDLEWRGLKLAAVDGVKPSNQALSDSSYPLIVYTYSYYNSDNEKGRALTDWLLTAEGQRIIAGAGYVGIFGEMPPAPEDMPDLHKDEFDSMLKVYEYYESKGMTENNKNQRFLYCVRLADRELTLTLADGNEKDVTVLRLVYFYSSRSGQSTPARYIVLTRERGGEFEVIYEGEFSE
jgi:phosphate transport system substrate-binding protein